ncbi:MAG: hypothetical protein Aurels2KO_28080 [Aureliella sp.]
MFVYHDSPENKKRLALGLCRCAVEGEGRIFDLVNLIKDDLIIDPYNQNELLSVAPRLPNENTPAYRPARYIYAVSKDLGFRIALDCDRKSPRAVKHETLFHNQDVRAAGEIGFRDGRVDKLDDISGSYGTRGAMEEDLSFIKSLVEAIELNQVPVSPFLFQRLTDSLE